MTAAETPSPLPILERSSELALLADVVELAANGRGSLVVIEGEAGIGKSTLVEHAARLAATRGLTVLRGRGTELERQYPYGIAVRLFEPLVAARPDQLFRGPAAAVAGLFGPTDMGAASADVFSTVHGLFWLAVNAAEATPLLLTVDDAQWADDASLRFLHHLSQRLSELPIVVVAAFRSTEPEAEEPPAASLRLDPAADHVVPGPLSEAAVAQLVHSADPGAADPQVARAVWDASRGNPFLVTELVRQRIAEPAPRTAEARPAPVPTVPHRVARSVEARVRRLDDTARRVAEAIAILGDEATIRRVATLAAIDETASLDAIRRLTATAIVDGSARLGFIHPLVRAAVYEAIPEVVRGRAHRQAALLLDGEGEPLGVVAGQLLAAERTGDPRVVAVLLEAGREALGRGEPAVTVTLLRRALEEPPERAQRAEILLALGRANVALGSPLAIERYAQALQLVDDPHARATVLLELGHAHINRADFGAAAETFEHGLGELGDRDPELHSRLEAGFLSAAWVGMTRSGEATARLQQILAGPALGPAHRELAVWTAFHQSISVSTSVEGPLALVKRVIDEAPVETLIGEGQLVEVAAGVLVTTDELAFETQLLTRAIAAAQAAGAYAKVAVYAYCRAWPAYYSGRLTDSIADAQAALAAAQLGWETFVPATHAALALSLLERDELGAAAEAASLDDAAWQNRVDYALLVPLVRGRIALARGDLAPAIDHLRAAAVGPRMMGLRNPVPPDWRIWLSAALAHHGDRDEAIEIASEALAVAREWGVDWPQGQAHRALGIAEGGARGLEHLRESVRHLDAGPAHLERARALVDLGAALRRAGHLTDARVELTHAMDLAFRLGAVAILRRSRDELRAAGARPRRMALTGAAALTPSEARVARLASEGRTNRQIAEALFVTPKAVEYHLANAYRKLGIDSRAALGKALGSAPGVEASGTEAPGDETGAGEA